MARCKISLATVISLVFLAVVYTTERRKSCYFSKYDDYQRYQCVRAFVGTITLIACSMQCCVQHRCIGIFHDSLSSGCMLINATEREEQCDPLNWNTWRAFRKKEDLGTCSSHLMSTVGYSFSGYCSNVPSVRHILHYVPSDSNEVAESTYRCLLLKLNKKALVRGVATQGRWRNESVDSCCDERVTAYNIHWSEDCDIANTWFWVDNKAIFGANVKPDAGNEVIETLFEQPVLGKCFAFYPVEWNLKPTVRWDVIGCEN